MLLERFFDSVSPLRLGSSASPGLADNCFRGQESQLPASFITEERELTDCRCDREEELGGHGASAVKPDSASESPFDSLTDPLAEKVRAGLDRLRFAQRADVSW